MYRIAHKDGLETMFWGVTYQWVSQWYLDQGVTRAQEFATEGEAQAAADKIMVSTFIVPVA